MMQLSCFLLSSRTTCHLESFHPTRIPRSGLRVGVRASIRAATISMNSPWCSDSAAVSPHGEEGRMIWRAADIVERAQRIGCFLVLIERGVSRPIIDMASRKRPRIPSALCRWRRPSRHQLDSPSPRCLACAGSGGSSSGLAAMVGSSANPPGITWAFLFDDASRRSRA